MLTILAKRFKFENFDTFKIYPSTTLQAFKLVNTEDHPDLPLLSGMKKLIEIGDEFAVNRLITVTRNYVTQIGRQLL